LKKEIDFICIGSPKSYALINLHKHLFGCSPSPSHVAEADCLPLTGTTSLFGIEWVEWIGNKPTVTYSVGVQGCGLSELNEM
jgi:hypothetical protein